MPVHSYFQHDDRDRGDTRNVKMGRRKNRKKFQDKQGGFKGTRYDEDGDIDICGSSDRPSNSRFKPYKNRPHYGKRNMHQYGVGRRHGLKQSFGDDQDSYWFKITIPFGKKLGKTFIMKAILSHCKIPFTSYNFHYRDNAAVFYVNDPQASSAIQFVSRRVTTPDGFKMAIHSSQSAPPVTVIDSTTIEKIKTCMGKRYNSVLNQLNLSSFCSDPDLAQDGLYISLHRPDAMNSVINIIKENIPQIQQLDLSKNRLTNLEGLSPLITNCREIKSLVLKNNKLKSIAVLNALKGMDLLELVLDGNALCDNFKDRSTYISTIREKFPRIIKLDGQELPAPVLFSLGTVDVLPASKGSSFPGEDVKTLVTQFLEQYYTIFDSSNRQPLLDAYHDQAVFSLSASKVYDKGWSLQDYILDSRNLLKIDNRLKHKLLRQGRLSIVSSLSQMPQTHHDPTSFTVDVSLVSSTLMCFTVTGVFKEVLSDIQDAPLRTFNRTFMVVPQGQGFSIINDIMYLTNATNGQVKAFRMVTPTPTPSPAPSNEKTPEEQQQMVVEFSNWTGMNFEFSAKCLEENDWDYQKAAHVFQTLNARGSIPVEAFEKNTS